MRDISICVFYIYVCDALVLAFISEVSSLFAMLSFNFASSEALLISSALLCSSLPPFDFVFEFSVYQEMCVKGLYVIMHACVFLGI